MATLGGAVVTGCTDGAVEAGAPLSAADADTRPIRLGYITARSGPLAAFGEADEAVLEALAPRLEAGFATRAGRGAVEVLVRDSASDPVTAAGLATELVERDGVDMILMASVAETMNPVSDTCEAAGVPCITTATPWESWFFGRGASPVTQFDWTFHFFIGNAEVQNTFFDMWDAVGGGGRVGALWPDDTDGRAWSDPARGFVPPALHRGYEIVDPAQYPPGTTDFTSIIRAFLDEGVDILMGVPTPPEFIAFWQQADALGFRPRLATIARALTFPSVVQALGDRADGLAITAAWTPSHPYRSSLTGQSAQDLAGEYEAATGRTWTQPIGFVHALVEVAAAALAQADDPDDHEGIAAAIAQLRIDTVAGRVDWLAGPAVNVAVTPVVGCQWRTGGESPELVVVSNGQAFEVPRVESVRPLAVTEPT